MKAARIIFHGFVLLAMDLIGIVCGFVAYFALGARDQLMTQLPIAVLFSVLLYLAWVLLLRCLPPTRKLVLQNANEYVLAGMCSLLWNPAVIIPLHYFTQGYFTGAGNIIAVAGFQIPVNALAIVVVWKATQSRTALNWSKAAPSPGE